jgi:hypothetical protein
MVYLYGMEAFASAIIIHCAAWVMLGLDVGEEVCAFQEV